MIVFLLIIAYSLATAATLGLLRPYRQASPLFWFPASLWLMAVGTFLLVDLNLPSDRLYVALFFVALIVFTFSAQLAAGLARLPESVARFAQRPETSNSAEERAVTVVVFAASALATVAYYYLVGYNVFFLLLSGQVDNNYSELRLATYSEGEYFAPGYFNQFKNVLLPLTAVAIGMWLRESRKRNLFMMYVAVAAPLVLLGLAGTGQRAFIVYTFGSVMFGFVLHAIGMKSPLPIGKIVGSAALLLAAFGLMTGAYSVDTSNGDSVVGMIFARFTSIQQESGLGGFRYTYPLESVNFYEWWEGLRGLLPGDEGSTLSHEIFAVMYGSTVGTAPTSLVGSAYYNGGVIGVIVVYALIGIIYALAFKLFLSGPRTILRSLSYGFIFFYLAIWVAEGPAILIDNGVVTVFLFLGIIRLRFGRRAKPLASFPSIAAPR